MKTKTSNLLIDTYPELLSEWDYEKNNANRIYLNTVTYGSHKKAWWLCKQYKHSYEMSIQHKTIGKQGCPFCAGQKVLQGFNDLQSKYPDLMDEWDWKKNNFKKIYPNEISWSSSCNAYWKCNKCHNSYNMNVSRRTSLNQGCPYCAGKKVLKWYNDLQTLYPDLIYNEWNWIENDKHGLKPDSFTSNSSVKAWWHCNACNGDYKTRIYVKTNGSDCPYCTGHKVLQGFNDLESCYPELVASEWDWIKNTIKPCEIVKTSHIKAWWKCCECGCSWKTQVSNRTHKKSGCPECAKHVVNHISKQEDEVADYINDYLHTHYVNMNYTMKRSINFRQIYNNLNINSINIANNSIVKHMRRELDIYIPEFRIAVEYDGNYWHSDEVVLKKTGYTNDEIHKIKKELCSQAGIELYFITEHDWLNMNDKCKHHINTILEESLKNKSLEKTEIGNFYENKD